MDGVNGYGWVGDGLVSVWVVAFAVFGVVCVCVGVAAECGACGDDGGSGYGGVVVLSACELVKFVGVCVVGVAFGGAAVFVVAGVCVVVFGGAGVDCAFGADFGVVDEAF